MWYVCMYVPFHQIIYVMYVRYARMYVPYLICLFDPFSPGLQLIINFSSLRTVHTWSLFCFYYTMLHYTKVNKHDDTNEFSYIHTYVQPFFF